MSVSFESMGNYLATIECIDKVLEKLDVKNNKLAGVMLYYSKLNSLFQLGRYGDVISLAQTEILPVLNQHFKGKVDEHTSISDQDFKSIDFETKYICSLSMALQGSLSCIEVLQNLYAEANEIGNIEYTVKAQLVGGIFKLLQGEMDEVQNILTSTQEVIPSTKDATVNTLLWLILKNAIMFFQGEKNYENRN